MDEEEYELEPETGRAEDSPEVRRRKADSLRTFWADHFAEQLPSLGWMVSVAERKYRLRPNQDTRGGLEHAVRELVACEVTLAHLDEVADEIESGEITYERGEQREFEAAYFAKIAEVEDRIAATKPQQLAFGW